MANQFDKLLSRILTKNGETVIIYNELHYSNLRAGLSKAKGRLLAMHQLLDDDSLENTRFVYTPNPKDPHKVTITLEQVAPSFKIIYADESEEPPDAEVPTNMGGVKD